MNQTSPTEQPEEQVRLTESAAKQLRKIDMVTGNQTRDDAIRYDNMQANRSGKAAGLALGAVFVFICVVVALLWYSSSAAFKSVQIPTPPAGNTKYQPYPQDLPGQK